MAFFKKNKFDFDRELHRARKITQDTAKQVQHKVVHKMPSKWLPQWIWAFAFVIILGFFFVLGIFAAWASVMSIPSINSFENRKVAESTKIYDRTGNVVLYDVHGAVRRTAVPLSEISPFIQHATVSIEDATFYQNSGFRPLAFLRAAVANITSHGYSQGGSTITQQVVKNALLTQDKTIIRKVEEIILALRLARVYTKDQILETYLNENGYGGTIYGVQEASQYFFGVDAKDVDLAQAAYLAALPQAPTHLSPYGPNKKELDARKNLVLQRMKDLGYIKNDDYAQAVAEQVKFRDETEAGIKAPHFVFFIRDYLESKYGSDAVENGGLKVITTLDYSLQQDAEASVAKYADGMQKNFNASNEGVVAVDPKTGQILAMVGSRDYFNEDIDGAVNVTTSTRQPGSSFKPFVYATALEKGYTPDTVVFDLQTQFSTSCSPTDTASDTPPCYSPGNFDGTFKGPMTFRDALAQSENVPAVKVLYLAGVKDSIKTATDLGISTLSDAAHYGLTLVLGGGEVKLLEMTGAYAVFANDGVKNPPVGILRVEDKSGNVLEQYQQNATQVLDPQIANQINDMLSDNVARIPEFGADSPLYFKGYDVADKTGTTNDFRDVWIIGYTPSISVGAWAGNNNNTPMAKKIAAFIIAPMWHDFMAKALTKYSSQTDAFTSPSPDPDLDTLPPVLRGNWNTDPSKGTHDILWWVNKDNPRSGQGGNPGDSQFAYWDYPVQLWAQSNGTFTGLTGQDTAASSTPGTGGGVPTATGLTITSPSQGTTISWGPAFTASVSYPTTMQISQVTYFINGSLVGVSTQAPFTALLNPQGHGVENLRAVAQTQNGNIEANSTFTVQ
jgi:1A family penicillin-binding protein